MADTRAACHDGVMADDTMSSEREFNEPNIEEFRRNGGKVGGQFDGFPLLLLTSTGARSGAQRDAIYPVVVERAPGFGEYQQRTDRLIPVFELVTD